MPTLLLSEINTPVPSRTVLELLLHSEFKASPDYEILSSIFFILNYF